jgi:hypothetical protein
MNIEDPNPTYLKPYRKQRKRTRNCISRLNVWKAIFGNEALGTKIHTLKGAIKMNKKTIIILILSGLALFGAGSFVGASSDWKTQLSVDSANDIEQAAKAKSDALTTNIQANIAASIKQRVNPIVDKKKQDIADQLQAYFDQKTNTITDSQAYKDAVADLDRIENSYLTKYKAEIDAAFAGQ